MIVLFLFNIDYTGDGVSGETSDSSEFNRMYKLSAYTIRPSAHKTTKNVQITIEYLHIK